MNLYVAPPFQLALKMEGLQHEFRSGTSSGPGFAWDGMEERFRVIVAFMIQAAHDNPEYFSEIWEEPDGDTFPSGSHANLMNIAVTLLGGGIPVARTGKDRKVLEGLCTVGRDWEGDGVLKEDFELPLRPKGDWDQLKAKLDELDERCSEALITAEKFASAFVAALVDPKSDRLQTLIVNVLSPFHEDPNLRFPNLEKNGMPTPQRQTTEPVINHNLLPSSAL